MDSCPLKEHPKGTNFLRNVELAEVHELSNLKIETLA